MAKIEFGEYSAYETKGGVRFMKAGKLTSEDNVPKEAAIFLRTKLGIIPKYPRPSEEEIAKLKAESLKVPVQLQRSDDEMEEARLTPDDFEIPQTEITPEDISSPVRPDLPLDSSGEEPLPRTDSPAGLHQVPELDFLEQVSIHTATLQDMAQAIYERFGIYTVYLGKLPESDEINPITGEMFTKYHMGIAYQAAIRAQNQGLLQRPAEEGRRTIDANRQASAHFEEQFVPVPRTMADARRANSFDYRTSVQANYSTARTEIVHERGEDGQLHAVQREIPAGQESSVNGAAQRYDSQEDEQLVEPRFGKKIIRKDW